MRSRVLFLAMSACAAMLVAWNLVLFLAPSEEPGRQTIDAAAPPNLPQADNPDGPARKGAAMDREPGSAVTRPLFWADRRRSNPPTLARAEGPPATGAASAWRLAGSIRGPGATKRALIVSPEDPNGFWLDVGAEHQGWRLTAVEDYVASVEAGGRRIQLRMFEPAVTSR